MHPSDRVANGRARAGLCAGLYDPPSAARDFDHAAALPQVVADGLLDVDVLAGLAGPGRVQRMQMVRRRERDDVDVVPREEVAHVRKRGHVQPLLRELGLAL